MSSRHCRIGKFVRNFTRFAPAGVLCITAFSCADGGKGASAGAMSGQGDGNSLAAAPTVAGSTVQDPVTGLHFVVDANQKGRARAINLLGAFWGRLVDVYDFDQTANRSTLQVKGLVIGENIASDQTDVRLDRNLIGDVETLTILHPAGTAEYRAAFQELERNVQRVEKNGVNPPPTAALSVIPRNAALVLRFDDLLDSTKITSETVKLLTGLPPIQPCAARVIPDSSHGDLVDADGDGTPEFHTTRIVIDLTTSPLEALEANPPMASNSLGLPEATVIDRPNVMLRLPTEAVAAVGQLAIVTNLAGSGIKFTGNASGDPDSLTQDVVCSMRSASAAFADPNHGFLSDSIAPSVVGVQGITLTSVLPLGGRNFQIDALFGTPACAPQPRVGDLIIVGSVVAGVTQAGSAPTGGLITSVNVVVDAGSAANFVPGPAEYLMAYDPALGLLPDCFVRFTPTATFPSQHVATFSTITVRFNKPMDPASFSAFESFAVTRLPPPEGNANPLIPLGNTIIGNVQPSADLKEFTYAPLLPFEHNHLLSLMGEEYKLSLQGGPNGVLDLSGQPLSFPLPAFNFRIEPTAPIVNSRGFVFKFNSADEDGNGAPELRGQFLLDLSKGTIRPRPVARFSTVADASQPVVSLMIPFTAPIHVPLSNLGSKMMDLYRYHDLGLSLLDDSTLNIDVEGLSWAPFGTPQVDNFARFRMAFCHSKFLPDEFINPMSLLPVFPNSGLVKTFDANQVDPVKDPLRVVHAKEKGYSVQPVDAFVASTGTLMMPYPLNRGVPTSQFVRYTFRDTGLLAVGGSNGGGVETFINSFATGSPVVTSYPVGKVPSLGLPLLMEFRCYPDDNAFGLNGFKVNLALNSSARPAFRAYSAGGVLSTGAVVKVDPDNQPNATGGFTPNGFPTGPGSEIDPVFYLGQVDFVVRVNRVHSIWLDTFQFGLAKFRAPVIDPPKSRQPAGTEIVVALRAADTVTNGIPSTGGPLPRHDATTYDPYGEPKAAVLSPPLPFTNWVVVYPIVNGQPDNTWKNDAALVNSLPGGFAPRFIQMRITLFSNPVTSAVPELTAVGIPYTY